MTSSNPQKPHGMKHTDDQGKPCVDLVAGISSVLGHNHPAVINAIREASEVAWGGSSRVPPQWHANLCKAFATFEHCQLACSADEANEFALRVARTIFGSDRYRVITLLGSRHGDSFLLRSASGRPEDQGFDGPVAAGFRHVLPGDINALSKAIDASVAAVCLSPMDWNRGGETFESEYLRGVESLCRERDILFCIDETKVPPGVGGSTFFFERALVQPDLITASAGWCGGLPGGMAFMNASTLSRLEASATAEDTNGSSQPWFRVNQDHRLLRSVITQVAQTLVSDDLLRASEETVDAWAAMLDDLTEGYDFIHGCVHAGLWTTIELDLPAREVVYQASLAGVRLLATGETTLLICPPITADGDELLEAISPLRGILDSVERSTATS